MSRLYPVVDRLLDGNLAAELREQRADGRSFVAIAKWLRDEHGVDVSYETVRTWCSVAQADSEPAA
jgi:intein-encoded DNA endonuclease-like protein